MEVTKLNILEQVRKNNKLNKVQMARRLGIGKSYYSMLLKGDRGISKNIALRLQKEFDVPLEVSLCPSVHAEETEQCATRQAG